MYDATEKAQIGYLCNKKVNMKLPLRFPLLLLSGLFLFQSCDWASDKAKKTVNKTGEVVGKAGSEFAEGVSRGIEKSFENNITLSDKLKMEGVSKGKIQVLSSDSAKDHILSAYLIFGQDFQRTITVKLYTEDGTEYGRQSISIVAAKGDARYFDIVFDKRTQIDNRGKITFD